MNKIQRRDFLSGAAALAATTTLATAPKRKMMVGICADTTQAAIFKEIGYDYLEPRVAEALKPHLSDAEFAPDLARLQASPLPLRCCNVFIPGDYKLTGSDLKHNEALEYAAVACQRADALGISYIVLGSGKARRMPEGFDRRLGKAQFIEFCKKLGERISNRRVTIVIEPLYQKADNLLNTVREGAAYVDEINHPRIQLLADFFHMVAEGETPDAIRHAGARIKHCHIAESDLSPPGTHGDDLRPYFKALQDINYQGSISCECHWPKTNLDAARRLALKTVREQIG